MRLQRCLTIPVSAACVIAATLLIASGQQPGNSRMQIKPTGRSDLTIEAYNVAKHHIFEPVFTQPLWAPMRPHALVLHNSTKRRIVGLNFRWQYLDSNGYPSTWSSRCDSFWGGTGDPLTAANADVLVVPGSFISSDKIAAPMVIPAPRPDIADFLQLSPQSSVELDSLILEDGEVIGPDQAGFVDSIRGRDAALKFLADIAANATNPYDAVAAVAASYKPKRGETPTERWIRQLAKLPSKSAAGRLNLPIEDLLERHLERRPLPNFYRKSN